MTNSEGIGYGVVLLRIFALGKLVTIKSVSHYGALFI